MYNHNPPELRYPDGNVAKRNHMRDCKVCWVLEGRSGYDAEIADVFEAMRRYMYGGEPYTPALIARVTREITTELGAWT